MFWESTLLMLWWIKEKVDWRPVTCFPIKIGLVFLRIVGNYFWTVMDLDEMDKQIIRVNQLSETKIYAHPYVNKSITALFVIFGFYGSYRKISKKTT